MLSLRLPKELDQELTKVSRLESQTKTHIIRQALIEYLAKWKTKHKETAYTLGEDLFGVYEGDSNLSTDYKNRIDKTLHAKYPH